MNMNIKRTRYSLNSCMQLADVNICLYLSAPFPHNYIEPLIHSLLHGAFIFVPSFFARG